MAEESAPEAAVSPDPERYDLRRFLRELAVAAAILAVGLPVVLLSTSRDDDDDVTVADRAAAEEPVGPGEVLLAGGGVLSEALGAAVLAELEAAGEVASHPGAGFSVGRPHLGLLLPQDLAGLRPGAVVVQGGEVDAERAPVQTAEVGALHLVDRIRLAVPGATRITLVGPIPAAAGTSGELLRIRDELRSAAAAKRVHFVDPVALGWRQGQADLAARLADALAPLVRPAQVAAG